jgi:phosphohistidine phosphatase
VLLYLMRHGAAEDVSPSGRDEHRALTPSGSAAVRRVALALRGMGSRPFGRIVASPLVRAQQTAEIMRAVLCPQPRIEIETDEDLVPEGSAYELAVRLASAASDTLLVGHQPNIESVTRAILAPPSPAEGRAAHLPSGFRTATVVAFHLDGQPPPYRLALVVDPASV